jgi:hypothetical protein
MLEIAASGCNNFLKVVGARADGSIVFAGAGDAYVIGPNGVTQPVNAMEVYPVFDPALVPSVIVGWTGVDLLAQGFACLAMEPERCWLVPRSGRAGAFTASTDGTFAQVFRTVEGNDVRITIARPIGPGDRAPPL